MSRFPLLKLPPTPCAVLLVNGTPWSSRRLHSMSGCWLSFAIKNKDRAGFSKHTKWTLRERHSKRWHLDCFWIFNFGYGLLCSFLVRDMDRTFPVLVSGWFPFDLALVSLDWFLLAAGDGGSAGVARLSRTARSLRFLRQDFGRWCSYWVLDAGWCKAVGFIHHRPWSVFMFDWDRVLDQFLNLHWYPGHDDAGRITFFV